MAKTDTASFDSILVLDFGSQYNQLITRRIRDFGVYSELLPNTITAEEIKARHPKGIIFSGGPTVFTMMAPFGLTRRFSSWAYQSWGFVTACN